MLRLFAFLFLLLPLCPLHVRADVPADPPRPKLEPECPLMLQIKDDAAQTKLILPKSLIVPVKAEKKSALPFKTESLLAFAFLALGFAGAYSLRRKSQLAALMLVGSLVLAGAAYSQPTHADLAVPKKPQAEVSGKTAIVEVNKSAKDATLVISSKALKELFDSAAKESSGK